MKSNNQIMQSNNAPKSFSAVINSPAMKGMINKSLADPRRAASFVSTLISVVSTNPRLKNCDPNTVISAALRGEGMGLSIALGQYSIVPYGTIANYQLSYKGLAQLAIRSGQYAGLDVFDVREGEYKGSHPRTREPMIEWLDEDERINKPLVGFYGYYELKSGFVKTIYWSHKKILEHADQYSKAFSIDKYEKLISGKMSESEANKLRGGSPWYGDPLSTGHMKMCRKTVFMQMLNDGIAPLSIEMQTALTNEYEQDKSDDGIIYADDAFVTEASGEVIDIETGEVVGVANAPQTHERGTGATQNTSKGNLSSDEEIVAEIEISAEDKLF